MACTKFLRNDTNFTVQNSILLGVAAISHTPSVDGEVLAMPYRLNPYEQFKTISAMVRRTARPNDWHHSRGRRVSLFELPALSSATLSHSNPSNTLNTPGLLISCQTPMLVVGTGSSTFPVTQELVELVA